MADQERGRGRRRRRGRGRGRGNGEASGPAISRGGAPQSGTPSLSTAEVGDSSAAEPAQEQGQLRTPAARPESSPIGASGPADTIETKRPGYGTLGTPVRIVVNCFKMDLPVGMIHHYDGVLPEDKVFPKKVTMDIVRQMQDQNHTIFTKCGCFDGRKNLYSPVRYPLGDVAQFRVNDPIRPNRWQVRIKWVAIINPVYALGQFLVIIHSYLASLRSAARYIEGRKASHDKSSQMTVTACNVAIRMQPIRDLAIIKKHFFNRADYGDLGRGVELWRGYFQSVRPMIENMVVNVDIGSIAFYRHGPLIGLCMEYLGQSPDANPLPFLGGNYVDARTRRELLKFIRGLMVRTTGSGIRSIKDISEKGADTITFISDAGIATSISTYFTQMTGHALNYPTLICVQLSKTAWVPLEHCEVIQGQFYRKTLTPDQTKHMIEFSTLRPDVRLQSIRNGLQVLGYSNSPCLQEFGVKVDPNPMTITGRILPTPTLLYGKNATIQPLNGEWSMRDKTLYKPAIIQGCAIIIYDGRFRPEAELHLKQSLFNVSRLLGIQGIPSDPPILRKNATGSAYWNHLKEVAIMHKKVKGTMPNLIIVVLPDFGSEDIYVRIKNAGDIKIGVATQCLKAGKCAQGTEEYYVNVCLKINAKLGGTNFVLKPNAIPFLTDLTVPSIVMGAGVTHPGPGNSDRPSYATVVGSVDSNHSKYITVSRVQGRRIEMIEKMADMIAWSMTFICKAMQGLSLARLFEACLVLTSVFSADGTCRSAHYSVLVDQNNFMPDDIQRMTFSLCHLNARSTRSTSIVAAVLYAKLVCGRAKHRYDPDGASGINEDLESQAFTDLNTDQIEAMRRHSFQPLHPTTAQRMYFL
ncbi:hypothetical protein M407DRAFT_33925 [Tulasnella calospora MUT 4182]|uniref:Piwi domain-containing protein n=1 Tax=Tulasnella calospora MUT 4182 TaxID=1051891 RepID=A0A0C3Q262_9AGAM|nr:hypothetical protein M407DRAFT_33925 [Tulasnella calospora MUT 4182]